MGSQRLTQSQRQGQHWPPCSPLRQRRMQGRTLRAARLRRLLLRTPPQGGLLRTQTGAPGWHCPSLLTSGGPRACGGGRLPTARGIPRVPAADGEEPEAGFVTLALLPHAGSISPSSSPSSSAPLFLLPLPPCSPLLLLPEPLLAALFAGGTSLSSLSLPQEPLLSRFSLPCDPPPAYRYPSLGCHSWRWRAPVQPRTGPRN